MAMEELKARQEIQALQATRALRFIVIFGVVLIIRMLYPQIIVFFLLAMVAPAPPEAAEVVLPGLLQPQTQTEERVVAGPD